MLHLSCKKCIKRIILSQVEEHESHYTKQSVMMKSGLLLFVTFGVFSSMQLLALGQGDVEKVNIL